MITSERAAEVWRSVNDIYSMTREQRPTKTIETILGEGHVSEPELVETFACIAAIKKHDGRIYGRNREWISRVPIAPECVELSHRNKLFNTGLLDSIHSSHINQMIEELRKRDRERWKMTNNRC